MFIVVNLHFPDGTPSSSQWKNSTGMSHQFHCHANFAGDKEFWNLEPHRTSTNYLEYLRHGCNPEN